ncbi:MAG: hypothetical protein JXB14_06075 [Candidatus Altiarchaeota archaeon]|nr:hypothetical protein [Candidatus Altiarchaeota archaeon]
MDLDEIAKYVKARTESGESLPYVLDDLIANGLPGKYRAEIARRIMQTEEDKRLYEKRLAAIEQKKTTKKRAYMVVGAIAVLIVSFIIINSIIEGIVLEQRWEGFKEGKVSEDPVQISYNDDSPLIMEKDGYTYRMTRLAKYKISGVVVSKMFQDDLAKISPIDFLIVWGDLADPEMDRYLKYSSGYRMGRIEATNRWAECPVDVDYINIHLSNNHLIPANDNIEQGMAGVRINEVVYMEGYLVKVESDAFGGPWTSSLARDDASGGFLGIGGSGCEIFYVERLVVGDRGYQ